MAEQLQKRSSFWGILSNILKILIALLLDLFSILPIINWFTLFFGTILFGIWFWAEGAGLINIKKLSSLFVSAFIEVIPALSILPGVTLGVILMIIFTTIEKKTGIGVPVPLKARLTLPGGRSKFRKAARRASRGSDHRRRARARKERLDNFRARKKQGSTPASVTSTAKPKTNTRSSRIKSRTKNAVLSSALGHITKRDTTATQAANDNIPTQVKNDDSSTTTDQSQVV